jgi:FkbM family methyltransferase
MAFSRQLLLLNFMRYTAALRTLPHFSDLASAMSFFRLVVQNSTASQPYSDATTRPTLHAFRMKVLGGGTVYCRNGLSDLGVLFDTFVGQYHLPPPQLPAPATILDLGSNIGLTMAHYAALYPEARILGIELDHENCELARKNVQPYGERCELIHGALWHEPGEVSYGGFRESGYAVLEDAPLAVVKDVAPAYTMEMLLDRLGVEIADFVKMDIEGAEKQVLAHASSWIGRVLCLKVEVHPAKAGGYTAADCIRDLESHGVVCSMDVRHKLSVIGVNPELLADDK